MPIGTDREPEQYALAPGESLEDVVDQLGYGPPVYADVRPLAMPSMPDVPAARDNFGVCLERPGVWRLISVEVSGGRPVRFTMGSTFASAPDAKIALAEVALQYAERDVYLGVAFFKAASARGEIDQVRRWNAWLNKAISRLDAQHAALAAMN